MHDIMQISLKMEISFPTGERVMFFFFGAVYEELTANDGLELCFGAKTPTLNKKIDLMSVSLRENVV